MNDYAWNVSRYNLLLFSNIVIYLVISMFFIQKSMFDGGDADGFYRQIFDVVNEGSLSTNPLYFVHLLRFLVVSPFYFIYINGIGTFFESILILLFMLPVLTMKLGLKRCYPQVIFLYLPLFFSYRSVLVMCSISYLYICIYGGKKSYLMLVLSMFMANLSSGVILPWILIAFMNIKNLSEKYKYIKLVAICIVVVFGFSVIHKFGFFYNGSTGGHSFLERNTFYVSIVNGQYARFVVYFILFLAWCAISLVKLNFTSFSFRAYSFYFPMFFTFFFEGLGVVSFIIPVFWFFMGVRPPFLLGRGYRVI